MRKIASLWALVVIGLLAAGCTGGPPRAGSDTGEPPVPALLAIGDLRTFMLPLDPYQGTLANLPQATKAEQLLIQRCVRRFGLDYAPSAASDARVVGAERRYGVTDVQTAGTYGYHLPPAQQQDPAAEAKPSPEKAAVLFGKGPSSINGRPVPDGGCTGEARQVLAKGVPAMPDAFLAESMAVDIFRRFWLDSRARKVSAAWGACMKRAGYDYADPMKANDDPAFQTPKAGPREIAVATADIACKRETNLVNVLASVETAYQARAVRQYAGQLAVVKDGIVIRERNAAAVLAGS